MSVKGFYISGEIHEYDYNSLENKPDVVQSESSGLTEEIRTAILQLAEKVVYIDAHGRDYYNDLRDALYADVVVNLVATFDQTGTTVYNTDSLDKLRSMLVVRAQYYDSSIKIVSGYTLSGQLTVGTSTITVSYGGKTTTFNVTVTAAADAWNVTNTLSHCSTSNGSSAVVKNGEYSATITPDGGYTLNGATISITMGGTDVTNTAFSNGVISIANVIGNLVITVTAAAKTLDTITATYTQSDAVYTTDSLDSLKDDLVVRANYTDYSSELLNANEYTLSGTLTVGTSTITVSYGGKTATFSVTVSAAIDYTLNPLTGVTWNSGYWYNQTTGNLETRANTYCSSKFQVQDCIYAPVSTNENDTLLHMFFWDAENEYKGYVTAKGQKLQLKPGYTVALQIQNSSSDFSSSDISMMPVDNRATAAAKAVIELYDYVDVIESFTYGFRIPAENYSLADHGITSDSNVLRWNAVGNYGSLSTFLYFRDYRVTLGYNGTKRKYEVAFYVPGVSTLADMQQYIRDNRPVIKIN